MAAPQLMPTSIPSCLASCRAVSKESSSPTLMISSMTPRLRMSGTKPAPMPWILCGPRLISWPAIFWLITGLFVGSTATTFRAGLRCLRTSPQPVIVPPVPTPQTRMSTLPSVSRQISRAVVLRWISGLAGFLNCWGM